MATLEPDEYCDRMLFAARVVDLAVRVDVEALRRTQLVRARSHAAKLQALGIHNEDLRQRVRDAFAREIGIINAIEQCQLATKDAMSPKDLASLIEVLGTWPVLEPETTPPKKKDIGHHEGN